MDDRISVLLERMKALEAELHEELEKKGEEFFYQILEKRIRFERRVRIAHHKLVEHVPRYLVTASWRNVLTTPVIWACLLPALFMDLVLTIYQAICFPVYGIPKVRRGDHVVLDRQYLAYLNVIERINCYYCGYFNGIVSYAGEIAARTEQYWCPIKHARQVRSMHSRYRKFLDYGDGKAYREQVETLRRDFGDLVRGA
jgi:hypothetical protein